MLGLKDRRGSIHSACGYVDVVLIRGRMRGVEVLIGFFVDIPDFAVWQQQIHKASFDQPSCECDLVFL